MAANASHPRGSGDVRGGGGRDSARTKSSATKVAVNSSSTTSRAGRERRNALSSHGARTSEPLVPEREARDVEVPHLQRVGHF